MLRRFTPLLLCAAAAAPVLWSTPAWAPFHLVVIEQVFFGTADCPNAQYVMLRTTAPGQVLVAGQTFPAQNADGSSAGNFATFADSLSNGDLGAAMLVATADAATLFGITPDQVASGNLVFADGRICFGMFGVLPVDCVAYGNFTGDNGNNGSPAVRPELGMALVRQSASMNNSADFALGAPAPGNNAGQTGSLGTCGGTAATPTPTATVASGGACEGDCNGNLLVAVNELVTAVNIVLGNLPLTACNVFPTQPSINNLIRSVNNLLNGCPATPTATTTSSTPTMPAGTPTAPPGTPTSTRTPGGPLGVRHFSLNPGTSSLIAVLSPVFVVPSTGFQGFLELTAGIPDPSTGIALVDVTDASDYLSISVAAANLTLCIRIDHDQLPVVPAGIVSCNGGIALGLELAQDHSLGLVGACAGGANDGLACTGDAQCPEATCFTAEACTAAGGTLEGAKDAHPGVCNGPFAGGPLEGDSGPGAVLIAPDPGGVTKGLPVEITMEDALPCGDEGNAPGISVAIALTTGRGLGRILDYNNNAGAELRDDRTGQNFSCPAWEEENGPGTFVFSAPQLDIFAIGSQPTDLISTFVLDD
jgi:hypothetical protein